MIDIIFQLSNCHLWKKLFIPFLVIFICNINIVCYSQPNENNSWEKINEQGKKPEKREPEHVFWTGSHFYLFGGHSGKKIGDNSYSSQYYQDIWKFKPNTREWTKIDEKNQKYIKLDNSLGFFTGDNFYFFGGRIYKDYSLPDPKVEVFNRIGVFDPSEERLTYLNNNKRGPDPEYIEYGYHIKNRIIVYERMEEQKETIDRMRNLWKYDIEKNIWKKLSQKKPLKKAYNQVTNYSETYPAKPYEIMFGGNSKHIYSVVLSDHGHVNKLFQFDFKNKKWVMKNLKGEKPESRSPQIKTWTGEYFIMYGGISVSEGVEKKEYNDLWICNPKERIWKKIELEGNTPNVSSKTNGVWTGKYFYVLYGIVGTDEYSDNIWRIDLSDYIN